jgi:Rrf2 family protein
LLGFSGNAAGNPGAQGNPDVDSDLCGAYRWGMITQKMKYALKALLVLADEAAKGQPEALTIEEIAKRSGTPKRFLEHILLEVRNAGVIASIRGRSGGYSLIKKPSDISISELLRTIDGPIAPLPCLSRRAYQRCEDCTDEATCRIRKVFAEVFWSYLVIIDSLTLADMLRSGVVADQVMGAAE